MGKASWRFAVSLGLLLLSVGLGGCRGAGRASGPGGARPVMRAVRAAEAVEVDGRLNDAVWQRAPRYALRRAMDAIETRPGATVDPGHVRFAWDENYLYLAAHFTDRDVHVWSDEDQDHHYKLGDVCELFLKPIGSTWYWELYATPRANKTVFWFPGPGLQKMPGNFEHDPAPLKVGAQVRGTLNAWRDVDEGWTAEMAVPVSMLTAHGDAFGAGAGWLAFVGRYNHSRYGAYAGPQLTMVPQLPVTNFHDWMSYARLELVE